MGSANTGILIMVIAGIVAMGSIGLMSSTSPTPERDNTIKIELEYGVTVYATIPNKIAQELSNDEWFEVVAEVKKAATSAFNERLEKGGKINE